jgi:hypothetical protein
MSVANAELRQDVQDLEGIHAQRRQFASGGNDGLAEARLEPLLLL